MGSTSETVFTPWDFDANAVGTEHLLFDSVPAWPGATPVPDTRAVPASLMRFSRFANGKYTTWHAGDPTMLALANTWIIERDEAPAVCDTRMEYVA
jgi:hypothetical protein